jgi:hypothetical protein
MTDAAPVEIATRPGRPTLYSDEIGTLICERLAAGETLRTICWDETLPSESTVRRWALDEAHPFSAQYARARIIGYHTMADEVLDVADDGRNDWVERRKEDGSTYVALNGENIQRSRLRVDTRKWLLSKALPKIYGDKTIVEGGDTPIQTVNRIELVVVDTPKAEAGGDAQG